MQGSIYNCDTTPKMQKKDIYAEGKRSRGEFELYFSF